MYRENYEHANEEQASEAADRLMALSHGMITAGLDQEHDGAADGQTDDAPTQVTVRQIVTAAETPDGQTQVMVSAQGAEFTLVVAGEPTADVIAQLAANHIGKSVAVRPGSFKAAAVNAGIDPGWIAGEAQEDSTVEIG